jgi:hypothetical protein
MTARSAQSTTHARTGASSEEHMPRVKSWSDDLRLESEDEEVIREKHVDEEEPKKKKKSRKQKLVSQKDMNRILVHEIDGLKQAIKDLENKINGQITQTSVLEERRIPSLPTPVPDKEPVQGPKSSFRQARGMDAPRSAPFAQQNESAAPDKEEEFVIHTSDQEDEPNGSKNPTTFYDDDEDISIVLDMAE